MKKPPIKANIYIVDYDPTYTASLKKAIEKPYKYNILTFTTGEKFIAHLATLKFRVNDIHIVFLGYHFYDEKEHTLMNGIEILEAVKVICPNIEVVMLYSKDESSYGAYARNSGAYTFVPKTDTIFLRINNIIMRIISQKKLQNSRRSFIISSRVLVAYFLLMVIGFLIYSILNRVL
jgi:DNA-binding NarL/FixJ family response regulator